MRRVHVLATVLLAALALMALTSCELFNALFGDPPTAAVTADPAAGPAPLAVTFDLSGSDVPSGLGRYRLDFGDGSPFQTGTDLDDAPVHTYAQEGTYTAALEITDRYDRIDHDTVVVTVGGAPQQEGGPVAVLAADTTLGDAPLIVNFDVSLSSSPESNLVSFRLDFDDGTQATVGTNFASPILHLYADPGIYSPVLTVTDAEGLIGIASLEIVATTVGGGTLPVARFDWTPAHPTINEVVTFDADASYDLQRTAAEPKALVVYTWDFGDGGEAATTTETVDHTYTWPGSYDVTLTIYDSDGNSGEVTQTIDVAGAVAYVSNVWAATVSQVFLPGDGTSQILHYTGEFAWDIAVSGDGTMLYAGGEDLAGGTIDRVDTSDGGVEASNNTLPFLPSVIACSPDDTVLYATEDTYVGGPVSSVWALDPATLAIDRTIPVQSGPAQIRFTPDGASAYVTCYFADTLDEIDVATHTVTRSINLAATGWPWGLAITSDGEFAVVTFPDDAIVALVRLADGAVPAWHNFTPTVEVPLAAVLTSDDRFAYVTDHDQSAVYVFEIDTAAETLTLDDTIGLNDSESLDIAITPGDTDVLVPHGFNSWEHWLSVIKQASGNVNRRSAEAGAAYVDVWGLNY